MRMSAFRSRRRAACGPSRDLSQPCVDRAGMGDVHRMPSALQQCGGADAARGDQPVMGPVQVMHRDIQLPVESPVEDGAGGPFRQRQVHLRDQRKQEPALVPVGAPNGANPQGRSRQCRAEQQRGREHGSTQHELQPRGELVSTVATGDHHHPAAGNVARHLQRQHPTERHPPSQGFSAGRRVWAMRYPYSGRLSPGVGGIQSWRTVPGTPRRWADKKRGGNAIPENRMMRGVDIIETS